jgi:hypothetical protein
MENAWRKVRELAYLHHPLRSQRYQPDIEVRWPVRAEGGEISVSVANITQPGQPTTQAVIPNNPQSSAQTSLFATSLAGSTSSSSTGTTNLFQQLTSDLQAFLVQLQGGASSTPTSSTTTPTNVSTNPSESVDSDGDSDGSTASSQGAGQVHGHHHHHHHFDSQETGGGASQIVTDATNLLNDLNSLLGKSGTGSASGSSSGSGSSAAVQAYAANNAQSDSSILQQLV